MPSLISDTEHSVVFTDKSEALKLVKKYKKARFKAFRTMNDAMQFAVFGLEVLSVCPLSPCATDVGEKPSPFRGPKPQDMVRFRKAIEGGDFEFVKKTVWENPRYLVSSGDTPAILQVRDVFSNFLYIKLGTLIFFRNNVKYGAILLLNF